MSIVSGRIIRISGGVPSAHDKKIYDRGGILEAFPDELGIGDKGYQGARRLLTPKKKSKRADLTEEEERVNKLIGTARITVERTIGRLKQFACFSTPWRAKLWKHDVFFRVIAQIINLSFDLQPLVKIPHAIFELNENMEDDQKQIIEHLGSMIMQQNTTEGVYS